MNKFRARVMKPTGFGKELRVDRSGTYIDGIKRTHFTQGIDAWLRGDPPSPNWNASMLAGWARGKADDLQWLAQGGCQGTYDRLLRAGVSPTVLGKLRATATARKAA